MKKRIITNKMLLGQLRRGKYLGKISTPEGWRDEILIRRNNVVLLQRTFRRKYIITGLIKETTEYWTINLNNIKPTEQRCQLIKIVEKESRFYQDIPIPSEFSKYLKMM